MEKIKLRIFFFSLIYLLFISNVNCQVCQGCKPNVYVCTHSNQETESCPSNCRPNLLIKTNENNCFLCPENIKSGNYYKITGSQCAIQELSSCTKIISKSFQCVESCPSDYSYSMGRYCYASCTGNMKLKNGYECECSNYYSKAGNDYECYSSDVICNPEHKYTYKKQCFTTKEAQYKDKYVKVITRNGISNIYEILDICNTYFYTKDQEKICVNVCPKDKYLFVNKGSTPYECVGSCTSPYSYIKDSNECVELEKCDYVDGTKCIVSPNKCLHNKDSKECVQYCQSPNLYKDTNNMICNTECNFINRNNECVSNTDGCFYTEDSYTTQNKICYSSCGESPNPFQIYDSSNSEISHRCVKNCDVSPYLYKFEKEQLCFQISDFPPAMKDIESSKYYLDISDNTYHCYYYAIKDDGSYKCYNNEEGCTNEGFKYKNGKNGNQCFKECTSFIYEVPNNPTPKKKLDECYENEKRCKSEHYYYYNTEEKRCYLSLPADRNANEIDPENRLPKQDEGNNTYTRDCGSLRFPKKTTKGICKKECDKDEYFKPDNPNECISSCVHPNNYIGYNNECLTRCPDYYISISNTLNKCVKKCKDVGKYYFQGEDKCYDSCKKNDKNYFYSVIDNRCIEDCSTNGNGQKYAYDNTDSPKPCLAKPEGKYYNASNIISTNKCILISRDDPQKCVDHCNGMKVYNKRCVDECPDKYGPYVHDKRDNSDNIYIDKCVSSCKDAGAKYNYIIAYRNECVEKCPDNYIADVNGKCFYANCPKGLKFNPSSLKCEDCNPYEKKKITITTSGDTKEVLICKSSCNTELKYIKDINDQECVEHCPPENNYIGGDYICRTHCNGNHSYFLEKKDETNFYQCVKYCTTEDTHFYIVELKNGAKTPAKEECVTSCPETFPFAIENYYECLQSCPTDKPYYYKSEKDPNDKYYACTSKFKCGRDDYTEKKYYCEDGCYKGDEIKNTKKKMYVKDNICIEEEECPANYTRQRENYDDNDIFICKPECDPNEYIKGNECLKECPKDLNYIGIDNKCKSSCRDEGQAIKYYPLKNITLTNPNEFYTVYKCVKECPYNYIYDSNDNLCLSFCKEPQKYLSKKENYCHNNCYLYSSGISPYSLSIVDGTKTISRCLSECNDPEYPDYKYYYTNEKVCLKQCENDDYAVESTNECIRDCSFLSGEYYYYDSQETNQQRYFCVKKCPSEKKYLRRKTCYDSCDINSDEKFSIKEFNNGEEDVQRKCSSDCPSNYPYFYADGKYECLKSCEPGHYIIPKVSPDKNATVCLESCNSTYKYKIENETGKYCYKECPGEKPFYKNNNSDTKCYDHCPPDAPFHEKIKDKSGFICKTVDLCNNEYALVDNDKHECLSKEETCPDGKKISKYEDKIVCLTDCMEPYGKYPTEYNTCVNDCSIDPFDRNLNLIKDLQNPQCICKNYYYKLDNDTKMCLGDSIISCKDTNDHKINVHGTKECIKTCDGDRILSPLEDICFEKEYDCHNYLNTEIYDKVLNDDDKAQKKCDCVGKYYYKDDEKICLRKDEICPDGYDQRYIPEKKQCLKNGDPCPDLFSYRFHDKYCLRLCPANSHENNKECICNDDYQYWRKVSQSNFECVKDCYDFHLVSIPSEDNRCVEKCEKHYSRFYNNECYHTCIDNNIKILNAIEVYVGNELYNYECQCKPGDSWYIDNSNIKHCIPDCNSNNPSFKYTIKNTSQCVNICPPNLYVFNNECFTNCEAEAYGKYHIYVKTVVPFHDCQCRGLWRYTNDEENEKECLKEDNCALPDTNKKFLFNETQCLEKCPSGYVGFNYLCSNNCPKYTIDKKSEKGDFDCSCNLNDGYWYEYQEFGSVYYVCGLKECPKYHRTSDHKIFVRNNLIESERKCVNSCRKEGRQNNKNVYALRNLCIEFCPNYTYTNKDDDACLFFDLNDTRITSLEQLKNAANVQVKELYEKSEKTGGFLFNKFNASLEIYAIDKENSLKDISFKSNLTYIDFGTCLDKIYADKSIGEGNKLLISKYDILPGANINVEEQTAENVNLDKYLINPVEYGLYSSNMSEVLDAHVCEPYEILISYPLVFSKFDKTVDGITQNEYRTKFQIGKDLYHLDNEIDTFNYNNTIYKNFCRGLEIEGKDLVYEDRYKYLYPNNKILCESNCTLNNTDFELGRVNCLCTYKNILDLKRIEKQTNDILNDPNFFLPSQNPANIQVIGCIFKFNLKQTIIYNGAFYFCAVGIIVQIIMLVLSVCIGIKDASIDIKHLLNKINLHKNIIGKKTKTRKSPAGKKEDIIGSTNRPLNNPPKKNDVNDKNNDDIDIDSINEEKDISSSNTDNISSSNNDGGNYEINLKKGTKVLGDGNEMKVEYIPPDYNFKFFKEEDKGVMKKIDRSKIEFEINPDTKYLIERREGIEYPEDYLEGPYYQDQNILIITDDKNKDAEKVAKFIKNEKISKDLKPKIKNNDKNNEKNNKNNDKANKEDDKVEKNMKKRINLLGTKKNNYNIEEKSSFEFKKPNQSIQKSKIDYSEETLFEEFYEENDIKLNKDEINLFSLVKREQLFLRIDYNIYMEKKHGNVLILFLAEILDKIYFVKICLFLRKVDFFSIHCSLYILCHIILLSLLCGFFSINIIKRIWEEENFPGLNFYLLYGLISHIIVWVVYQIFLCFLDNQDKVKDLIILKNQIQSTNIDNVDIDDIDEKDENILRKKYNDLIFQMKFKTAMFYTTSFLLSLFLMVYLISFFALYTGTKRRVWQAYYISIIEILLIKFVYGLLLSLLRFISTINKIKCLYDIVKIFNKYIS